MRPYATYVLAKGYPSTLCLARPYLIRQYLPLKKLLTFILCRIENLQGKTLIFNIKKTCHKISPDKSYHKVCLLYFLFRFFVQIFLHSLYPLFLAFTSSFFINF
jgi:hypothetical protein